jgi:hypothetical protein
LKPPKRGGALTLITIPDSITQYLSLTLEQNTNYVPFMFTYAKGRIVMVKSVVEEAVALASITLFLAMVAVWTQVLGVL